MKSLVVCWRRRECLISCVQVRDGILFTSVGVVESVDVGGRVAGSLEVGALSVFLDALGGVGSKCEFWWSEAASCPFFRRVGGASVWDF